MSAYLLRRIPGFVKVLEGKIILYFFLPILVQFDKREFALDNPKESYHEGTIPV